MKTNLVRAAIAALVAAGCSGGSTSPGTGSGGSGGGGGAGQCPAGAVCMVNTSFEPPSLTVARGAAVTFANISGIVHNVTFAAPAAAGVTDIPNHSSGSNGRTFPNAGTHAFTCTLHAGMNGQIVVQ